MRGTDTTTDPRTIRYADMIDQALSEAGYGHVGIHAVGPFDPQPVDRQGVPGQPHCIGVSGITLSVHARWPEGEWAAFVKADELARTALAHV